MKSMVAKKSGKKPIKVDPTAVRASVTFPIGIYHTLEELTKQKKVSIAWVVRDAAEKYVEGQWPLLGKG